MKRLESQVKLYIIIIKKVHIIMFHLHQNVDPAIFFDLRQHFVDPRNAYNPCQSQTHGTHETMKPVTASNRDSSAGAFL